jgi:ABC-2 type transport system permease protein
MNFALLRQTWRFQGVKLTLVCCGLLVWGFVLPIIYAQFGVSLKALMDTGMFPPEFARFGNGDILSLSGAIALSLIHPISIVLTSVFAIGFSSAIAGERQRGTLEVTLARPLSRQTLYITLLAACFGFVGVAIAALLTGGMAGATFSGVVSEIDPKHMPLLWLNGVLLFGALGAIGLAASVTFDRLAPALGWTLGIGIVMYVFEVLGSLWPDAAFLQPYSLFHYLQAKAILIGEADVSDLGVLGAVVGAAILWALVVFPRRDLAAPS